jgi:hypothetical protein
MDTRYLTAIALSDTFQPADAKQGRDGVLAGMAPEHAFVDEDTLCGLPRKDLYVMRHYWRSSDIRACARCTAALLPPPA